jgi:hypothetical protein
MKPLALRVLCIGNDVDETSCPCGDDGDEQTAKNNNRRQSSSPASKYYSDFLYVCVGLERPEVEICISDSCSMTALAFSLFGV